MAIEITRHQRSEGTSFRLLLFGPTKTGKSTFASYCKDEGRVLFIAAEEGYDYLEDVDLVVPANWQELEAICSDKRVADYDTVVLDGVAAATEMAMEAICKKFKVDHPSQDDDTSPAIWHAIKVAVGTAVNKLKRNAKNVILTAHDRSQKVQVNQYMAETRLRPDISAGVLRFLLGAVDFVGYLSQVKDERTIILGPTKGIEAGQRRQLFSDDTVHLGSSEESTEIAARLFYARATGTVTVKES